MVLLFPMQQNRSPKINFIARDLRQSPQEILIHALARMSDELVDVGLGRVPLRKIAKHLLKLRKK